MARLSLRLPVFFLALIPIAAHAQSVAQPDAIAGGLQPYQSYDGGKIDRVSLQDGNLFIRIPLISYPQRGKLKLSYSLVWNGKPFQHKQLMTTVPGAPQDTETLNYWWQQNGAPQVSGSSINGNLMSVPSQAAGWRLVDDQDIETVPFSYQYEVNGCDPQQQGCQVTTANGLEFQTPDGAIHATFSPNGSAGTGQYAVDGSGIYTGMPFVPDVTNAPTCSANCYIMDADGIIYHPNGSGTYPSPARIDPDGNEILAQNSSTILDTMGRQISMSQTTQTVSQSNPAPAACTNLASGYVVNSFNTWTLPGANGNTLPYIFCYAPVLINLPAGTWSGQGTITNEAYNQNVEELVALVLPNGLTWQFQYNSYMGSCQSQGAQCNYGDLTALTFPTGGQLTYTYSYQDPVPGDSLSNSIVMSRSENSNDGTGFHTWSYSYAGFSLGSAQETATVADPLGNKTVHTFANLSSEQVSNPFYYETLTQFYNPNNTLLKTVATQYQTTQLALKWAPGSQNSLPTQIQNTLGSKTSTETHSYCGAMGSSGAYYDFPCDDKVYDFAVSGLGSSLREEKTSYLWQNSSAYATANMLGLVQQKMVVNGAQTFAQTTYSYDGASLQSSGIGGSLQHVAPLQAVRGHVTSTDHWLGGGTDPVTTAVWYDTGEVYQAVQADNTTPKKTTTYNYDPTFAGALPTLITDALGHTVSYWYDPGLGLKTLFTDNNGKKTQYAYDNYGRLKNITHADGGSTTYNYNDSATSPWFSVSVASSKNAADVTQVNLDGFGREIETQEQSDPVNPVLVDTTNDALGRKATVSNPYRSKSELTYGLTTYSYDGLSRPVSVAHPDNTTMSYNYTGAAIEVVDETGTIKTSTQKDALGRVTFVCEEWPSSGAIQALQGSSTDTTAITCSDLDNAPNGFETKYAYDPLGDLTSVTQGSLPVRSFTYDTLARLTSAYNPESGTTTYTYDADSNILTRTRPSPNQPSTGTATTTASYSYDLLNRVTGITYSDTYASNGPTAPVTYQYDCVTPSGTCTTTAQFELPGATNLIGRLVDDYVKEANGTYDAGRAFSYDAVGRDAGVAECTVDDCQSTPPTPWYYEMLYSYDINGNPLTEQLLAAAREADNFTLSYGYNAVNQLTSMTSSWVKNPTYPASLFASGVYGPMGGLVSGTLGNGATETFAYDKRNRLGCETVASGGTTLYNVALNNANGQCPGFSGTGYAGNGNVVASQDSVNGNWTYAYDNLSHLISATASTGPWAGKTATWTYDRFGNRWGQAVTGNSPQSYSFTSKSNRVDQYINSYDAAGNLMWDQQSGITYTYDDENRVIKGVQSGATVAQYWYDAEGQRIRKVSAAGTEEYVYDPQGHQVGEMQPTGTFNRIELYAGARHLATYDQTPAQTVFIHDDWQGTERVRSLYSGASYETCTNLPYGDFQSCVIPSGNPDPSPLHYTGKMRDAETQLDYFGARYYSNGMGHWMSPDWADKPTAVPYANFGDPQSLNLYGMVIGNPVSKQDADGHLITFYDWTHKGAWGSDNGAEAVSDAGAGQSGVDPPKTASTFIALDGIGIWKNTTTFQDGSSKTSFGAAPQNDSKKIPDHMVALGDSKPNSYTTIYVYGLENSHGDLLTKSGYGVTEHIVVTNDTGDPSKTVTSEDRSVKVNHGLIQDRIALNGPAKPTSNLSKTVDQTFTVDYKHRTYQLPNIFTHTITVSNGVFNDTLDTH